ncbi:DNA repair protein rad52 [Xylographa carneopallida]|nr:DNA repair protein rad52 [Xylographa carneopallida]
MSSEAFTAFRQPLPPEEEDRIASLLRLHLAREEISSRAGAGSARYSYLPTSKAVELANYIFGHDGWSSSIQDITIDFLEESKEGRWNVGVSCIMRVTLRGGSYHEDVGYGQTVNMPGKAEALEKAKKESCSDGLKRAMRLFGNKLGNSLSDQQYMTLLKSGKGQKEPLDLTQSPRKRMKLEPALTASTQLQPPPPHNNNHNSHSNSLSHVPQSPIAEGYPVSPQQPYQPPSSVSPNKPMSPNAAGTSLNMSPPGGPSTAGLSVYNRQPAPSPPVAAVSAASFPYKARLAPNAPPRPLPGKENAVGGGGIAMDTSGNAPLPSIHGIIHSLPASAHAAASAPYSSIAYSPPVKQEAATAAASYGPPSAAASSYANHAQSTYAAARSPYGQVSAQPAALPDAAMPPPHTAIHAAYAPAGATFPSADTGGGFIAHEAGSATAPSALAGGSFFGADDDDSGGFISQWLTHNGPAGGQGAGGTVTAVPNNA